MKVELRVKEAIQGQTKPIVKEIELEEDDTVHHKEYGEGHVVGFPLDGNKQPIILIDFRTPPRRFITIEDARENLEFIHSVEIEPEERTKEERLREELQSIAETGKKENTSFIDGTADELEELNDIITDDIAKELAKLATTHENELMRLELLQYGYKTKRKEFIQPMLKIIDSYDYLTDTDEPYFKGYKYKAYKLSVKTIAKIDSTELLKKLFNKVKKDLKTIMDNDITEPARITIFLELTKIFFSRDINRIKLSPKDIELIGDFLRSKTAQNINYNCWIIIDKVKNDYHLRESKELEAKLHSHQNNNSLAYLRVIYGRLIKPGI